MHIKSKKMIACIPSWYMAMVCPWYYEVICVYASLYERVLGEILY